MAQNQGTSQSTVDRNVTTQERIEQIQSSLGKLTPDNLEIVHRIVREFEELTKMRSSNR
jgi:hypothetical protein